MNYVIKSLVSAFFICLAAISSVQANNSSASAIAIDQNQKLVLAGVADNGLNNVFAVARLNLDGSPDTTFDATGITPGEVTTDIQATNAAISAVVIDSQNRIVVAGTSVNNAADPVSTVNGNNQFTVVRYNNDGSLDQTFNASLSLPGAPGIAIIPIGTISDIVYGLALDSLGRIVVVGTSDGTTGTNNLTSTNVAVVRLNPDGTLDQTFTTESTATAVDTGVTLVEPGIITVSIINPNGQPQDDAATCVAIGTDNSIFIGGSTTGNVVNQGTITQTLLIKMVSSGALDKTFVAPSLPAPGVISSTSPAPGIITQNVNGIDDQINAIGIDANGNLLLGGFTTINSPTGFTSGTISGAITGTITEFLMLRYTQEGVLFNTIVTNILNSNCVINALTFDKNNNIIVSGAFSVPGNLAFVTARYALDGMLDPTFNATGSAGTIETQQGIVVTNVLPVSTTNFFSNDNQALGVVTDDQNNIYPTGYSNDGNQNNFTTLSYLVDGALNINGFNIDTLYPGQPAIIYTIFFGERALGNGVPLFLGGDISKLTPQMLQSLNSEVNYAFPVINAKGPIITSDPAPVISGSSSPFALITLLLDGVDMITTTADYEGKWSTPTIPLADGTYMLTARASDPISDIEPLESQPVVLTIDTSAMPTPVIETPQSGIIKVQAPLIEGTAQPESVVTIIIDNKEEGMAHVQSSGRWTFSHPLTEGPHTIYAVGQDSLGRYSPPSSLVTIMIDTGKPQVPRIVSPQRGGLVKQSPLYITGEGKPATTIGLYANNVLVAPIKVDAQGRWSYALPVKDGPYGIYAATADQKLSSPRMLFTVKLEQAQKESVAQPESAQSDRREEPSAAPASTEPGLLTGKAQPGSAIALYVDGHPLGKAQTDPSGTWNYTPDTPLAPGKHAIKVAITDKDGNITSLIDREVAI